MTEYYVSGCVDNGIDIETVEDDVAEFWTLYERDKDGLSQGIVDLRFREDAEAVMAVYIKRDQLQDQVKALAAENEELKYVIAQLLQDAQRIQQLEPNAGTDARISAAKNALRAAPAEEGA